MDRILYPILRTIVTVVHQSFIVLSKGQVICLSVAVLEHEIRLYRFSLIFVLVYCETLFKGERQKSYLLSIVVWSERNLLDKSTQAEQLSCSWARPVSRDRQIHVGVIELEAGEAAPTAH